MPGPLDTVFRIDLGKPRNLFVRYENDVYDRVWTTDNFPGCISVNTTSDIIIDSSSDPNLQQFPSQIWTSACQPRHPLRYLMVLPPGRCPDDRCYFCLYFSEILNTTQIQEFDVVVNNKVKYGPITLQYLKPVSLCQPFEEAHAIILNSTNRSQLPPLLSAMEFYVVLPLQNSPTDATDVEGMSGIVESYKIQRDEWQGDPCVPAELAWDGLNCSYDTIPPRITSLDLSSMKLTGNISSSFSILRGLKYLDLSNNELIGTVPEFLAELPNLTSLNLSGNKLTGLIPQSLREKSNSGLLQLSLERNPNICESADSCVKKLKRTTNFVVPLTTSVIGGLVLLILISFIMFWRKQIQDAKAKNEETGLSKSHSFSFAEIVRITDDFKTIIGEGGFGKVYLGTVGFLRVWFERLKVELIYLLKNSAMEFEEIVGK